MYKLTNTKIVTRIGDGASIPNDPSNSDCADYLKWLAAGNTPLPMDVPTQAQIAAAVLDYARSLRTKLFTVVDGLQASALALGNSTDATAIETFKAGLRNITKIDLSLATTDLQMRAIVEAQYKALALAAPPSVQLAFAQAVQ